MKQLNKFILILAIIMTCTFTTANTINAEETLNCSITLKNGSYGTQVKLLQTELNKIMSCGLTVDGDFGTKTQTCVINFQKQNSLTQDGIVGSKTCTKLNQLYNNTQNNTQSSTQNNTQNNTSIEKTLNVRSNLKNGSSGEQVKLLQKELNKVMGCGLTIDGAFGSKSQTCVINFQKKYGLTADGIVGIATAEKLNITYLASNNYVVVNASSTLNVRADATTSSTKLGEVPYGTIFQVYGSKTTNGTVWYKIKYNNKDAYISSTYASKNAVIVDISSQTLQFYKDGKLTIDTPVITGKKGVYDTPVGNFKLSYKTSKDSNNGNPIHLSKYDAYVDYWMPFNGGIGFHDANIHNNIGWRSMSEFYAADRYVNYGSHGCINMIETAAKTLYSYINSSTNIFVVE